MGQTEKTDSRINKTKSTRKRGFICLQIHTPYYHQESVRYATQKEEVYLHGNKKLFHPDGMAQKR